MKLRKKAKIDKKNVWYNIEYCQVAFQRKIKSFWVNWDGKSEIKSKNEDMRDKNEINSQNVCLTI